jgi:5-methylcytosine-specific restriction endonuclease McrA
MPKEKMMPIKSENKKRYPKEWKMIALSVKEKADWKCQVCGKQCRKPNEPFDTHKRTLTVAHLNHIPEDVSEENLKAMCAPCHLRYDAKHHAETRKNNASQHVQHVECVGNEVEE